MIKMYRHEDEKCVGGGVAESVLLEGSQLLPLENQSSSPPSPERLSLAEATQQLPHVWGRSPESRIKTWEWGTSAPPL